MVSAGSNQMKASGYSHIHVCGVEVVVSSQKGSLKRRDHSSGDWQLLHSVKTIFVLVYSMLIPDFLLPMQC